MATSVKRGKGKFVSSCALINTNLHCDEADCYHDDPELHNKLVLYVKLRSDIRETLGQLNLLSNRLRKGKSKIKICEHCISYLINTSASRSCEQQTSQCDVPDSNTCTSSLADHSYSSTSSESEGDLDIHVGLDDAFARNDSSTGTDNTSSDETGSEFNENVDFRQNLTSTPKTQKSQNSNKKQKLESSYSPETQSSSELQRPSTSSDDIIGLLKYLPQSELSKVAQYLGASQVSSVRQDCTYLNKHVDSLDHLTNLDISAWLDQRNPVVLGFIKGISGRSEPIGTKPLYSIVKSVEQVYSTQSTKHVLPLSFSENIVSHSVVNSKLAANINGLSAPAGSYWTLRKWLESQASDPLPPPIGDCIIAFDNDQVIGKTYHVRANCKLKSSVVTSVCCAQVDIAGTLQQQSNFKPEVWHKVEYDKTSILDYNSAHHMKLSNLHYDELSASLQLHIDKVLNEQQTEDGILIDEVEKAVKAKQFLRKWRICGHCQSKNARTKRLCEHCRQPLRQNRTVEQAENEQEDENDHPKQAEKKPVEVTFPEVNALKSSPVMPAARIPRVDENIRVTARDPVFTNPNSFESVKEVFIHIGKDLRVKKYVEEDSTDGTEREWLLMVCDGVPYVLGQKVIADTYHCHYCPAIIYGKSNFKDHSVRFHNIPEADIVYSLEFDWVHLRIGYGHYEMNMVRSFIEFNWDFMVKDLASCMGFTSENAQKYAKKGSDHHKSWELLNILYEGCMDELLLPYIRSCIQNHSDPTPAGYLQWSTTVRNPTYQVMQEQILTYAQAILNFRKGVRFNNAGLIMAGKFKHAPLFHGRNHPKYQQIELTEARNDVIMPPDLKMFVHSHQSISQSGIAGRGEDLDFILENINKRSKVWTPKGVPSESDWLKTFRNLDKLDEMRTQTLTRMGCKDPKGITSATSSHTPRQGEVSAWREALRESRILENPHQDCLMKSVSGEPLDDQLPHFTESAWARRRYFYKVFLEGVVSGDAPDPTFVLPAERVAFHDIHNQTKDVIAAKIMEVIQSIPADDVKLDLLEEWSSVSKKKKDDYIQFLEKISEEAGTNSDD